MRSACSLFFLSFDLVKLGSDKLLQNSWCICWFNILNLGLGDLLGQKLLGGHLTIWIYVVLETKSSLPTPDIVCLHCAGSKDSYFHNYLVYLFNFLSFSLSNKKRCLFYSLFNFLQFFDSYEKLLTSSNYVTRRQSLKVSSGYIYIYIYFKS